MNQEVELDVLIYEEDMQQINDKVIVPLEIGQLTQSIVDIALRRQKEYYDEMIDYLLEVIESEHYGLSGECYQILEKEFNYGKNKRME